MHPLPSTETEKEHIGNRSGRVFLAALMLLACFYPSSTRAQEAEKDRQKAHRTAPPDWDAGLIGLVLPARRAKPAATLLNAGDSISPGAAFTNPVGAGTINNRAGSLSLGTGSTSAPSQFSGHPSRPPITSDTWLGGLGNWSNPANWSMGVPANDGTTDVFIDNGNSKVSPVTLDVHAAIHNITIDMDDSLSITNGNSLAVDGPSLTNNGTIALNSTGSGASLNFGATSATLSGIGTVSMSNNATNSIGGNTLTVTMQETIQGSGTINLGVGGGTLINQGMIKANQSVPLVLSAFATTNTGTIEAINGGTLALSGGTYNNTGGSIQNNNSSTLILENNVIIDGGTLAQAGGGTIKLGGTMGGATINTSLTNSSTGTIEVVGSSGNNTISGKLTNPTGGQVKIDNAGFLTIANSSIVNAGTFSLNSTGGGTQLTINASKLTLSGKGMLVMSNSSGNLITAMSPNDVLINQSTIEGGGGIGNGSMGLTNSGTILANNGTLTIFPSNKNFTNSGKLTVTSGNTLDFIAFSSNGFSTSGTVSINSGGTFDFQSGSASYTQTKGSTTVDGHLTSSNGISISGGTVFGNLGTLVGNFNLSGTGAISPGDGIKKVGELTINGAYTQGSTASALIDLGGLTSGKFDVVNITNAATLNGKLVVDLVNGFKPVAGNSFDIINYASETGTFSSETLPVITGDHWLVTIGATDVLLQLLAGPGVNRERGGSSDAEGGFSFAGNVPPTALPPTFDGSGFLNSDGQPAQTPEPSSLLLLATGLLGFAAWARRRRHLTTPPSA